MSTPHRRWPAICSPNPDAEIVRRLLVLLKVPREHALSLIGPDQGAETDYEARFTTSAVESKEQARDQTEHLADLYVRA
jgi:hypothetical protein